MAEPIDPTTQDTHERDIRESTMPTGYSETPGSSGADPSPRWNEQRRGTDWKPWLAAGVAGAGLLGMGAFLLMRRRRRPSRRDRMMQGAAALGAAALGAGRYAMERRKRLAKTAEEARERASEMREDLAHSAADTRKQATKRYREMSERGDRIRERLPV